MVPVAECKTYAEVMAVNAEIRKKRKTIFGPYQEISGPSRDFLPRTPFSVLVDSAYPAVTTPGEVGAAIACLKAQLKNLKARQTKEGPYTIERIIGAVTVATGISKSEINGTSRFGYQVKARHIAIALAHRMTTLSLPALGRIFGGRDHTTILHAINRLAPVLDAVSERMSLDDQLSEWVERMKEEYDEKLKRKKRQKKNGEARAQTQTSQAA